MPIAAMCKNCKAPLSEASVIALAPVCGHCGAVMVETGGTLGLSAAYGVSDRNIELGAIDAHMAFLGQYLERQRGMRLACTEQLGWGADRYAKLPEPPVFFPVLPEPDLPITTGLVAAAIAFICAFIGKYVLLGVLVFLCRPRGCLGISGFAMDFPLWLDALPWVVTILAFLVSIGLPEYLRVVQANGTRPAENARRKRAYDEGVDAALKAAVPVKEAQDHRLRTHIRELEGTERELTKKLSSTSELRAATAASAARAPSRR